MGLLSVQQLLTPATQDQARSVLVTVLQAVGLQPQNWAKGGIASSLLTGAAALYSSASSQLSNAIAQQWNPTATGGGLQLLSKYFYGTTPPQPTFATGDLVLTNRGGGIYSYAPGQAFFSSTVKNDDGVSPVYTNVDAIALGAGSPSSPTTQTIEVQAFNVEGSGGNSNPGFVSSLVTSMQGVSVTNPASIVGSDALSDAALRALNISSLAVTGNAFGPRAAYAYAIQAAVNVSSGLPVNVNRWSISIDSHTGQVTIVVASPAGPVLLGDLQGISNSIEALGRPDGVTVLPGASGFPSQPASATTVAYEPAIDVYVIAPAGTSSSDLADAVETALTTWFESPANPIGGLVASDDDHTDFQGIFETGVAGVIAQGVATVPGARMISAKFNGEGELPLTAGQVATNETTVNIRVQYA